MFQVQPEYISVFIGVFGTLLTVQILFTIFLLRFITSARKERSELHKEIFGLVRKLEGLTASKREQMLKHYDTILDDLTHRLPPTIAAQAGEIIFETESKILSRLAEIEPNLKEDERGKQKMDQLIKSMENLEGTIVRLTADAVQDVFAESRKNLFEDKDLSFLRHQKETRIIETDTPFA